MSETAIAPAITYKPVTSSQIAQLGYDSAAQVLGIKFVGGGTYHYFDVPQDTFDALASAESIGKQFGATIRSKFKYEKQPDEETGIVFGLLQTQEPKYTTSSKDGRIVNRSTGVAIPDDEPVFILRAKDAKAYHAIVRYAETVNHPEQREAAIRRAKDFADFCKRHPERMQEPTP